MKSVAPAATFRVDNKLGGDGDEKMGVNLTFNSMDDFSPAGVAKQVPALNALLEARKQLSNLQRYMDGKVAAEDQIKKLLADPKLMAALSEKRAESSTAKAEDEDTKE